MPNSSPQNKRSIMNLLKLALTRLCHGCPRCSGKRYVKLCCSYRLLGPDDNIIRPHYCNTCSLFRPHNIKTCLPLIQLYQDWCSIKTSYFWPKTYHSSYLFFWRTNLLYGLLFLGTEGGLMRGNLLFSKSFL